MRRQTHNSITFKSITFVLAVLLALSAWMPLPGRAEAQMRCVGASPESAPCARIVLPAAGLTEAQVYSKLMPCCRSMRIKSMRVSAMHCSMQHSVQPRASSKTAAHRSSLSAQRCLVTIHVAAAGATAPAGFRNCWLLSASPALAPPVTVQFAFAPALFTRPACWIYSPPLSPHAHPHLHGLRAPPAA